MMTLEQNLDLREDISNLIFLLELTNDSLCEQNINKAAMKQFRQVAGALEAEIFFTGEIK